MPEDNKTITVLHTSDWHLGRSLYGRKRYEEQQAFLDWLVERLEQEQVDVLLLAGDVFDNGTPSNQAQELYYRFLHRAARSRCRHVVIIGGNHDSPSFLSASSDLLGVLDVHVIGAAGDDTGDELLHLGREGEGELLVCAVPYLRERDIRLSRAGESLEDKERGSCEGIRRHYEAVTTLAEEKRVALGRDIPIIVMGHLFAAGGQTVEGDGVRDLYVGTLAHVSASIFPASAAYVALGHLHVPQKVKSVCEIRYSGSPIPMGFGEAGGQKSVCLVQLEAGAVAVRTLPIPVFQKLERIRGDREHILTRVNELLEREESVWLEIILEGEGLAGNLKECLEELTEGSPLEVLRVSSIRLAEQALALGHEEESLADLDVSEVFTRCLDARNIPEEQRDELLRAYGEVLHSLATEGGKDGI